jgi:hypothetical protein
MVAGQEASNVLKLADAADLKSAGGDTVRVRPPLAPQIYVKEN